MLLLLLLYSLSQCLFAALNLGLFHTMLPGFPRQEYVRSLFF